MAILFKNMKNGTIGYYKESNIFDDKMVIWGVRMGMLMVNFNHAHNVFDEMPKLYK
ncbi:hypothetical protein Hdeb2414_s0745g00942291 [Helianthus debilis subsp. tardiflorus]